MNVRVATVRDVGRMGELYELSARSGEGPSLSSPRMARATATRMWNALGRSLPSSFLPSTDDEDVLVAEQGSRGVVGFLWAQRLRGALSCEVTHLCTVGGLHGERAADDLLTALGARAYDHGVRRIRARILLEDSLIPILQRRGFYSYATEEEIISEPQERLPDILGTEGSASKGRAMTKDDVEALYRLYLSVTPPSVARVEAPTMEEWRSTFAHGAYRPGRDMPRAWVWGEQALRGWVLLVPSPTKQFHALSFLVSNPQKMEEFIDAHLLSLPDAPVISTHRTYDTALLQRLLRYGFAPHEKWILLTCDVARTIKVRSGSVATALSPVRTGAQTATAHVHSAALMESGTRRETSLHV